MNNTYTTKTFHQTQQLGEAFAQKLKEGDSVFLYGDLGAGKTTFIQGLAKGLGIQRRIISPTFIIMRTYDLPNDKHFYHIDLYRTQTQEDIEGLGIQEIFSDTHAIVAIEWPEKLEKFSPKKRWEIYFKTVKETEREISIRNV